MNKTPDHYELYQSISDLIDYCRDNDLPKTKESLTVTIAVLCQEESAAKSLAKRQIDTFPTNHLSARLS